MTTETMWVAPAPADLFAPETVDLDIVIPVLNEELRLGATLEEIRRELDRAPYRARVIVVDNGCTDATADVVDVMSERLDITLISCAARGKGAAVRRGVLHSTAPYVAYCDADLSTPPSALHTGMDLAAGGPGAVIGSRRVEGAEIAVAQPFLRRFGSRAFNRVAVQLVGPVRDTQCGFKLLDGDLARAVFEEMRTDGYAFDVELIARLQRRQTRMVEMPVTWSDNQGTRLRMASDGVRAFRDLLAVRRAIGAPSSDEVRRSA